MHSFFLAAADTVLMRQVPPERTGFEQTVFVASGLAQIVTLVVVVLLAVIFYRMWKAQQALNEQLTRLSAQIDPMIKSATAAAENVRALTDTVRRDAGAAAEALSDATARVRDAVSGIADRIDDVGELLGRVTAKADAVVDVASAAASTIQAGKKLWDSRRERGPVRDEPRHLRDDARPAAPHRPATAPLAHRETAPAADEGLEEPLRLSEDEDAHDSPYAEESPAPARSARRRRRRRRRGGGGGESSGDVGGPLTPG